MPNNPAIVVSVVSLGHGAFILNNLAQQARPIPEAITLVITDLSADASFEAALKQRALPNIIYYAPTERYGYGKNNNTAFQKFAGEADLFVVCNPDVEIDFAAFYDFITGVEWKNHLITCKTEIPGGLKHHNVRRYFNPIVWVGSFLKVIDFNYWYYGAQMEETFTFDWCSGAFMVFDAEAYRKLGGFDEGYFMYIEDTDICYRCDKLHIEKKYYPTFVIRHFAQRQSKNIFNKHFLWIVKSVCRYYLKIATHKM